MNASCIKYCVAEAVYGFVQPCALAMCLADEAAAGYDGISSFFSHFRVSSVLRRETSSTTSSTT